MALESDGLEFGGLTIEMVEDAASISTTHSQVAFILGKTPSQWRYLKGKHPELEEAYIRGVGRHITAINRALLDKARDGDVRAAMYLDQKQMMEHANEEMRTGGQGATHEITGMGGFLLEGLEE